MAPKICSMSEEFYNLKITVNLEDLYYVIDTKFLKTECLSSLIYLLNYAFENVWHSKFKPITEWEKLPKGPRRTDITIENREKWPKDKQEYT